MRKAILIRMNAESFQTKCNISKMILIFYEQIAKIHKYN